VTSDFALREQNSHGFTVECKVHFRKGRCGRKRLRRGERPRPTPVPLGNIPRVSRLMALAIRFQRLIDEGAVQDYADLARLGQVTRARITQIMNLLHLAPDIQEEILFLPRTLKGHDPITERKLRPITAEPDWEKQRRMWREIALNRTR